MMPLFTSAILLAFVHAMMKFDSEHGLNRHTRFEGRDRGGDN